MVLSGTTPFKKEFINRYYKKREKRYRKNSKKKKRLSRDNPN
jgi:hypothetical protein